jgi:hypothetical protein
VVEVVELWDMVIVVSEAKDVVLERVVVGGAVVEVVIWLGGMQVPVTDVRVVVTVCVRNYWGLVTKAL